MHLLPLYFKAVGKTNESFKGVGKDMEVKVRISLEFQFQNHVRCPDQIMDDCYQKKTSLLDALVHSMETRFLKGKIHSNNFTY